MSCVLLWFKNDLRLHDNESLHKAIAAGMPVLPVYCFDPKQYANIDLDFPKADGVRFDFVKQCVEDLRHNLQRIGANLLVTEGDTISILVDLVKRYGCKQIFAEQEFATEEMNVISELKELIPDSCKLTLTWGRTLYHLNDIPYKVSEIPLTSKAYRINTTKISEVRVTLSAPTMLKTLEIPMNNWGNFPAAKNVGLVGDQNYALTYMEGGESNALERLDYYLFQTEHLTSYRWTRNRSLGLDYSSKFSPYLATGCISPRTIYEAVKTYESTIKKNQSTWWLIFEMVWRDYFTFKLMRFQNQIYHTRGYTTKIIEFQNDTLLFERWCQGRTGIPFVDAHMRQLNETGFMSNRGRVNCSSFLIHDYAIDWTWGAAYFESKLIDYDVGSNWMNWHTQAYQIWYTNPVNQANKYKAQEFIRTWLPEIAHLGDKDILIPWEVSVSDYPRPAAILSKWTRAINKIRKDLE